MTNYNNQKNYKERQRLRGYSLLRVWCPEKKIKELKTIAKKLRDESPPNEYQKKEKALKERKKQMNLKLTY